MMIKYYTYYNVIYLYEKTNEFYVKETCSYQLKIKSNINLKIILKALTEIPNYRYRRYRIEIS